MSDHLSDCVKTIRVMNAVAAGTSDQNSSVVDTAGYDGVRFVALFGTLTATQVTKIKVQQGQDSGLSDAADLEGTATAAMADGDSNKMLISDIIRPRERYVRCVVDRGTANAVIDGVIAELYRARGVPVTQDTSVSAAEQHVAPAEGTA